MIPTHLGSKGFYYRDSIDADPILNLNRTTHLCAPMDGALHGYHFFKAVCGTTLAIPVDAPTQWNDRVWPRQDGEQPTCRRCRGRFAR